MSAQAAAWIGSGISILCILCVFLFVPILFTKIGGIRDQLRLDRDEFKILEQEIWDEVMNIRQKVNPRPRVARQAAVCRKFEITQKF